MSTKPPRGITPYRIVYKRRIEEIVEGMTRLTTRFLEHYDDEEYRERIAAWCDEIKLLLDIIGKLQNVYNQKGR